MEENKPFQTKNDDLAGFWDMVMIQVEQVYALFDLKEEGTPESSPVSDVLECRHASVYLRG